MISTKKVNTFLFGSRSEFDDFCHEIVTELKNKYQDVKRVYVRAEYPFINANYENYLLEKYEETYYPEKILGAGKASYVERNFEMIDESTFCIFYYNEEQNRKSGTEIAYNYAKKKEKIIYNVFCRLDV